MRKLSTLVTMVLLSGVAHAESLKPQLFDCMNAKSFELNSQCLSNKIETNMAFKQAQSDIVFAAEDNTNNAMATVSFYPKQRLIEVVAHRDAVYAKNAKKVD